MTDVSEFIVKCTNSNLSLCRCLCISKFNTTSIIIATAAYIHMKCNTREYILSHELTAIHVCVYLGSLFQAKCYIQQR